jgi:hypothetical protein
MTGKGRGDLDRDVGEVKYLTEVMYIVHSAMEFIVGFLVKESLPKRPVDARLTKAVNEVIV